MESRMEKYYEEDLSSFQRTKKNQNLYDQISKEMSDLDNLPIPSNINEIDINGLKNIISSREEYQKAKKIGKTFEMSKNELFEEEKKEEKIYDINVLLENAKNEISHKENAKERIVSNNFLTSLKEEESIPNSDDAIEISEEVVNKKVSNTASLPLDILADLKGNENTTVTDPIIKEDVTMIKKIKDNETFYSGSFNFSKKDFDDDDDDNFMIQNNHTFIKTFFLIFGILLLIAVIYLILTKYVL